MKRTSLCLLVFLLVKLSIAQLTTKSEYEIVKTWYAENEKYNPDIGGIKAGYQFTKAKEFDFFPQPVKIIIRKLIRPDATLAGTLLKVIIRRRNFPPEESYYCLPAPNSDKGESHGWKLFMSDLDQMDKLKTDAVRQWLLNQIQYTPEKQEEQPPENKKSRSNR